MIKFKLTKKHGFTLPLEDTFLKEQRRVKLTPTPPDFLW